MYIAESNVFYCILCLCIVTVALLLYLAIWATIALNTLHIRSTNYCGKCLHEIPQSQIHEVNTSYAWKMHAGRLCLWQLVGPLTRQNDSNHLPPLTCTRRGAENAGLESSGPNNMA